MGLESVELLMAIEEQFEMLRARPASRGGSMKVFAVAAVIIIAEVLLMMAGSAFRNAAGGLGLWLAGVSPVAAVASVTVLLQRRMRNLGRIASAALAFTTGLLCSAFGFWCAMMILVGIFGE